MVTEDDARAWELSEGPWHSLKGLLVKSAEQARVMPNEISLRLMNAIVTGEIMIRIRNSNHDDSYSYIRGESLSSLLEKHGVFKRLDWKNGTLKSHPNETESFWPIDAYWPDVLSFLSDISVFSQKKPSKIGRPKAYDWDTINDRLTQYLYASGFPEPGKQAGLEKMVEGWFPDGKKPSESMIRDRVRDAIKSYKTFNAIQD